MVGVGQNTASHASPTARNYAFLIKFLPFRFSQVHSPQSFSDAMGRVTCTEKCFYIRLITFCPETFGEKENAISFLLNYNRFVHLPKSTF